MGLDWVRRGVNGLMICLGQSRIRSGLWSVCTWAGIRRLLNERCPMGSFYVWLMKSILTSSSPTHRYICSDSLLHPNPFDCCFPTFHFSGSDFTRLTSDCSIITIVFLFPSPIYFIKSEGLRIHCHLRLHSKSCIQRQQHWFIFDSCSRAEAASKPLKATGHLDSFRFLFFSTAKVASPFADEVCSSPETQKPTVCSLSFLN